MRPSVAAIRTARTVRVKKSMTPRTLSSAGRDHLWLRRFEFRLVDPRATRETVDEEDLAKLECGVGKERYQLLRAAV